MKKISKGLFIWLMQLSLVVIIRQASQIKYGVLSTNFENISILKNLELFLIVFLAIKMSYILKKDQSFLFMITLLASAGIISSLIEVPGIQVWKIESAIMEYILPWIVFAWIPFYNDGGLGKKILLSLISLSFVIIFWVAALFFIWDAASFSISLKYVLFDLGGLLWIFVFCFYYLVLSSFYEYLHKKRLKSIKGNKRTAKN